MATIAQNVPSPPRRWRWFQEFLKQELSPYPGRAGTVARMIIAVTLVVIICMTFRVPYGFLGAIDVFVISRDSPRATLQSAGAILLATAAGAAYVLISASFVLDVPLLHFFWIVGSFFLAFFGVSTMTNYTAAVNFANMIGTAIPVWDRHLPTHTNVDDTLWLLLSALIGVTATAVVELAFRRARPGDEIVLPLADRLAAVQGLVACYIEGDTANQAAVDKITRYAILGTSRLRPLLRRSDYSPQYRLQMSGVTALVARLVDIAANLAQVDFRPSSNDQEQLRELAAAIASIRSDLMNRRIPGPVHFKPGDNAAPGLPKLREMETAIELIPQVFAGALSMDEYQSRLDDTPRPSLFVPDALANPEHFEFALKGCLAASLCYISYTSINWPGISTSVITCMLTALSTIGGSRQKQILRFTGAIVGGFLFGMGSQIFILPHLDSIAGFTVLFIIVTAVSSWVTTSSPRLSYFGLQAALAFYLINLQEFAFQTSLLIARDRVLGILLGLLMMWLTFDQLWSAPAAVEMKRTFISTLRALARLVREPLPGKETTWVSYPLRETINANLDQVRALADGVLFEFGPSRQRDLALRDRIRRWQPQLRIVFGTRIALSKYRLQLPSFELPQAVHLAQLEFDDRLAAALDGMADRMEGKPVIKESLEDSLRHLEETASTCCSEPPQEALTAQLQSFLLLSRRIESLTSALDNEVRMAFL